MILDSGARREFDSGAVRDIQEGKGRCDLLPLDVVGLLFKRAGKAEQCTMLCRINDYVRYGEICGLLDAVIEFAAEQGIDIYTMMLEVAKHYEEGSKNTKSGTGKKVFRRLLYRQRGATFAQALARRHRRKPRQSFCMGNARSYLDAF